MNYVWWLIWRVDWQFHVTPSSPQQSFCFFVFFRKKNARPVLYLPNLGEKIYGKKEEKINTLRQFRKSAGSGVSWKILRLSSICWFSCLSFFGWLFSFRGHSCLVSITLDQRNKIPLPDSIDRWQSIRSKVKFRYFAYFLSWSVFTCQFARRFESHVLLVNTFTTDFFWYFEKFFPVFILFYFFFGDKNEFFECFWKEKKEKKKHIFLSNCYESKNQSNEFGKIGYRPFSSLKTHQHFAVRAQGDIIVCTPRKISIEALLLEMWINNI